jgi:hypothetical protein
MNAKSQPLRDYRKDCDSLADAALRSEPRLSRYYSRAALGRLTKTYLHRLFTSALIREFDDE